MVVEIEYKTVREDTEKEDSATMWHFQAELGIMIKKWLDVLVPVFTQIRDLKWFEGEQSCPVFNPRCNPAVVNDSESGS